MLAVVIKITSKLSLSPSDIQIILIIYRTHQCQHKFHNLWTANTHSFPCNHKPIFAQTRASVAHFAHWAFFICSFTVFAGFEQQKWSFGGEFIVLQFNFPWFPGLEFGFFFFFRKKQLCLPLNLRDNLLTNCLLEYCFIRRLFLRQTGKNQRDKFNGSGSWL